MEAKTSKDFREGPEVGVDQRIRQHEPRQQASVSFRVPEQRLLPWNSRSTVSAEHVAKLLDVSVWTVGRMCQSGELKAYKMREGRNSPWRISYDSVVSFIEKLHENNALPKRF